MAEKKRSTYGVITIGSGVIDHYIKSGHFEMEKTSKTPSGLETCLPIGAKIPCDDFILDTGGGATNAAVTFAHLGIKTSALFRVGKDAFADILLDQLKSHKVHIDLHQVDKKLKTGQSVILLSGSGHRTILAYRGASAELDAKDITWSKLSTDWFYVTSLAGNTGLMRLITDHAERNHARIAWNPGGMEIEKGLSTLKPLIKKTDILILNREEAALLTGEAPRHLRRIIETLGELPKVALLVSDGPKGAYLHSRGCTWHAPPLAGRRVNTTGAGDALGSGFVAGFIESCDLSVGIKIGMLNAIGVISEMGAKNGLLKTWPKDRELARVKVKPATL